MPSAAEPSPHATPAAPRPSGPTLPNPPAPAAKREEAPLGRSVQTVSGLTLVSRVLGLVRDVLTAALFGTSAVGSAFAAAFAIPNTFRRLFGEGALSAAFLPEYARLDQDDPRRAAALASLTLAGLTLVTALLTLLGEAALLLALLALPADTDRSLSLRLIMAMLPFMPLISLAAILGGMLQSHARFGPWAAAPILLNLFMIATALPFLLVGGAPVPAAFALGAAAVAAALAQVVWSLLALRRVASWRWAPAEARDAGRRVLRRFGPVVLGLGTLQVNSLLDTLVAMWPIWVGASISTPLGVFAYPLDESSNAILFYAQRLYQFPLGVFGVAVATAVFPALSRQSADPAAFGETLRRGLRLSLFIALPASVGLLLVSRDVVAVIFGGLGDRFTTDGLARTATVLALYAAGVWAYSVNQVLTRAFYAAGDTRTPTRVAIAAVALNTALNLALIWWLREAGLALATALSASAQTVALLLLAHCLPGGRPVDRPTTAAAGRLALLTLGMGAAVLGVLLLAAPALASLGDRAGPVALLAACVGAGGLAYLVLARWTHSPELRWLLHRGVSEPTKNTPNPGTPGPRRG